VTATGTELLTELVDERARMLAENERLRGRVLDLEAKVAILCGSLAKRAVMPEDEQPAVIHHDVKPNAPR
jgi:cell division septum initiation protein DivIVA